MKSVRPEYGIDVTQEMVEECRDAAIGHLSSA